MFSFPYLLNNGFRLYGDMVHPYTPFLTTVLAFLFKLFGYKLLVLQIFTYFLIFINDILIYKISKKVWPILIYVLLQPLLEGNMLWFDFATTPFLLAATYFLNNTKLTSKKLFFAGLFLSFAFLTKQSVILFLIFTNLFFLIKYFSFKKILILNLGFLTPVILFLCYLVFNSQLTWFINWCFYYPFTYWGKFPGYLKIFPNKIELVILVLLFIPVIQKKFNLLIMLFLAAGTLAVYPRFSFFHFQVALPFLIIAWRRNLKLIVICLSILTIIFSKYNFVNFTNQTRFFDNQTLELAEKVKALHTKNIYFMSLPSHLYMLTNSLPPKPWFDNYGWYFEIPGIQQEVIDRWAENKPELVVVKKLQNGNQYDLGTYQPAKINQWFYENSIPKQIFR